MICRDDELTTTETAELLSTSPDTVRRLDERGVLPAFRLTPRSPRASAVQTSRHCSSALVRGWPYAAVGTTRAVDSAIGLPSRSMSASWMLVFLMPADVRRSLMLPRES